MFKPILTLRVLVDLGQPRAFGDQLGRHVATVQVLPGYDARVVLGVAMTVERIAGAEQRGKGNAGELAERDQQAGEQVQPLDEFGGQYGRKGIRLLYAIEAF